MQKLAVADQVIVLRPESPEWGFVSVCLGGVLLFGVPTIALVADPGRRDLVDAAAGLCGALITSGAGFAAWKAVARRRKVMELKLSDAGLALPDGRMLAWSDVVSVRVVPPGPTTVPAPALAAGMGASLAAKHLARSASLLLVTRVGEQLRVGGGLLQAAAEAAAGAIEARRQAAAQAPSGGGG